MSVVGSAVSLALLVVLALCCQLVQARTCNYVSENLKRTHESIAEPLGLKLSTVAEKPLFSPLIQTINSSFQQRREQVLMMNATLDIYLKIFSSLLENNAARSNLLNQLTPQAQHSVRKALQDLQRKVLELKRHMFHDRQDKVRSVLTTLDNIQVDDALIQKKALAEFKQVYQAASVIGSKLCGHTS